MSNLFIQVKQTNQEEIKIQRSWLRMRNTCNSETCLLPLYQSRIEQLKQIVDNANQAVDSKPESSSNVEPKIIEEPNSITNKEPQSVSRVKNPAAIVQPKESSSTSDESSDLMGWFLFAIFAVPIVVILYGFSDSKRCPRCQKWYSEKTIGKELSDRSQGFKTVTRQDQHKDRDGRLIKTVGRQEQIQVINSTYKILHECRKCKHQWTTEYTVESAR